MKNFKNYRLKSEELQNVVGGAPQEILDEIANNQQPDQAHDWAFVTLGKDKDKDKDKGKGIFSFNAFGSKGW